MIAKLFNCLSRERYSAIEVSIIFLFITFVIPVFSGGLTTIGHVIFVLSASVCVLLSKVINSIVFSLSSKRNGGKK